MEGETYASISMESESMLSSPVPIGFLHGRCIKRRFFCLTVQRRITRTNYLVQDVSGKGVLSIAKVSEKCISSLYAEIKETHQKRSLLGAEIYVVGNIEHEEQEYPFVIASAVGVFSFCKALEIVLG